MVTDIPVGSVGIRGRRKDSIATTSYNLGTFYQIGERG